MNKQLGWTSLDQSKKLVEAGLDPNTADMHIIDWRTEKGGYFETSLCYSKWDAEHVRGYMPCWSLGALIGLMPLPMISQHIDYSWGCTSYPNGTPIQENDDTLIEVVCNMVINLLEQGYIKKRKQNEAIR